MPEITLPNIRDYPDGYKTKAVIVGQFAIHKTIDKRPYFGPWSISVRKTGFRIITTKLRRIAIQGARVLRHLPGPWNCVTKDEIDVWASRNAEEFQTLRTIVCSIRY